MGHHPSVLGRLLTASLGHDDGGVPFFYAPHLVPSINVKKRQNNNEAEQMGDLSEPADLDLVAYRQIIKTYMRYVLITSTKHIDTRAEVVYITLYTFASAYTIMNELNIAGRIGLILDTMVDIISDNVIKNPESGKQTQKYGMTKLLLKDKKVRKIAKALNALDGFSRQVLVLHYIEDMSSEEISVLYPAKSISEIETAIILASKQLVEQLAKLLPKETILLFDDVGKWLNRLKDCLDLYVMVTTGSAALLYLNGVAHESWEPRYKIEIEDWNPNLN
jgi:hypothetical protein